MPLCVIPCDSTDTWIAAAYEENADMETVNDPWSTIISRKKDFHGVKVPRHRKTKAVYGQFIPVVCERWDIIKAKCTQAADFERLLLQHLH